MIVLASSSPRRSHLLRMLGIEHVVDPAHIEESIHSGESAEAAAVRLAREKAREVSRRHAGLNVLAADTIVAVDDELLGKPSTAQEACEMLRKLSGRQHRVVTAVAVAVAGAGDAVAECDVTQVWMRAMGTGEIESYVGTGEPLDKAGAYAVQGRGAVLVDRIEGDFFGVMGLPLRLVVKLLEASGTPYRFTL